MRADIHDGQEHERSIHGPDTEAQDQSPPSLTSDLQHTAGPYSWDALAARECRNGPGSDIADAGSLGHGPVLSGQLC
jgi:hypothetical protein